MYRVVHKTRFLYIEISGQEVHLSFSKWVLVCPSSASVPGRTIGLHWGISAAQFFQGNDFETYRPSYEKKRGEARARRQAIEDAAQRAYWDPLTTVEAERNAEMEQTLSPEKQPTCPPAT